MPKFLEKKLKSEYGQNSKIPYRVMSSIGAMKGNKETPKGQQMEAKHLKGEAHSYSNDRPKRRIVSRYK